MFTWDEDKRRVNLDKHGIDFADAETILDGCTPYDSFDGLLADTARALGTTVILRGLRAVSDFEYELQMASMNRRLVPEVDTLFLTPAEPYAYLSAGSLNVPTAQLLVSQGTNWYGLRGFWLAAALGSASSLVGVVIEQINRPRLDLHQAKRLYNLSPREISVITALAGGKTDKEIASTLDVSPETVRWYLKNIRTKMDVSTRTGILHAVFF